jgi:hypothetical protein
MSKLMPCSFCKDLYEAIDLEQMAGDLVTCFNCNDQMRSAERRAEELDVMRSRREI